MFPKVPHHIWLLATGMTESHFRPWGKGNARCLHWCCPGHGQHVLFQLSLPQLQHLPLQSKVTQQERPRQQQVNANGMRRQEWVAESRERVMWAWRHLSVYLVFQGPPSLWPQAELSWLSQPFCSPPGSADCQVWALETTFFQTPLRN